MNLTLSNNEKKMLKALRSEPEKSWNLEEVLESCNWTDQSHVVGSGQGLHDQKLIEMKEKETNLVMLGPEGFNALEEQLIEKRIVDWVIDKHEKGEDSSLKQLTNE